jgi:hypothetical protein
MAVVLARQVADCFCPTGGTEHRVTETLSGIHLFKSNIDTHITIDKSRDLLDKEIGVLLLQLLNSVL